MALKILLDARKLGHGGIGVYLENLVSGLLYLPAFVDGRCELSLIVNKEDPALRQWGKDNGLGVFVGECLVEKLSSQWNSRVNLIFDKARGYSLDELFAMPYRLRSEIAKHDLFHCPHYVLPHFIKIPKVVTIHDIIHVTHPDSSVHLPDRSCTYLFLVKASRLCFDS